MKTPFASVQRPLRLIAALSVFSLGLASQVHALIMVGGDQPMRDVGFPQGATEMANLSSRHSYWEGPPFGGGEYHFNYEGDREALVDAAEVFAQIVAPNLEVHLYPGPHVDLLSDNEGAKPVDWTFVVWIRHNFNRVLNDPRSDFMSGAPGFRESVPGPALNIYLDPEEDLPRVVRRALRSVRNLSIIDHRASKAGIETNGAAVHLWVLDAENGKPIEGATASIRVRDSDGWVDHGEPIAVQNGEAQLLDVPVSATLGLRITAPNKATRWGHVGLLNPDQLYEQTFYLQKTVAMRGRVVDSSGAGIAGATVRVSNTLGSDGRAYTMENSPEMTTDADGAFSFSDLPQGYLQFRAYADGYHALDPLQGSIATDEDEVVLRLSRAGSVELVVKNDEGQPISQVDDRSILIEIEPEGGSAVGRWGASGAVDPSGRAQYSNIPPGIYRAVARPNPGSPKTESTPAVTFEIHPSRTTQVELQFSRETLE